MRCNRNNRATCVFFVYTASTAPKTTPGETSDGCLGSFDFCTSFPFCLFLFVGREGTDKTGTSRHYDCRTLNIQETLRTWTVKAKNTPFNDAASKECMVNKSLVK